MTLGRCCHFAQQRAPLWVVHGRCQVRPKKADFQRDNTSRYCPDAAVVASLATIALLNVGPFKWLWNFGGIEYNVFWCLTALAVAVTEFKRRRAVL